MPFCRGVGPLLLNPIVIDCVTMRCHWKLRLGRALLILHSAAGYYRLITGPCC